MAIILLVTVLLIIGVKESVRVNTVIVCIKIGVILLFLYLAFGHIRPANWVPFMPFGWSGVITGAAIVFFAYIGFDAVSTAAEEVKNPQRNVPIGILSSLAIATVLYIAVSAVLTGIVPYSLFSGTSAPVAFALEQIGISWGSALISVGAICGITSVIIVLMYGQTRIFFAMSRDGLLPVSFGEIHPVYRTRSRSRSLSGPSLQSLPGFSRSPPSQNSSTSGRSLHLSSFRWALSCSVSRSHPFHGPSGAHSFPLYRSSASCPAGTLS